MELFVQLFMLAFFCRMLAASNAKPEIGLLRQHTDVEMWKSISPTSLSGRREKIVYLATPLR